MLFLDLIVGDYERIDAYFQECEQQGIVLSQDHHSMRSAAHTYRSGLPIDTGESGTVYRKMKMLCWSRREDRVFVQRDTALKRSFTDDPHIFHLAYNQLLQLDGGTSQYASAAFLLRPYQPLMYPEDGALQRDLTTNELHYKFKVAIDAKLHWLLARSSGKSWQSRQDPTIIAQATAIERWAHNGYRGPLNFKPEQAEDTLLAMAFGILTPDLVARLYPQVANHESNRLIALEEALAEYLCGQKISTGDHRVVTALALRYGLSEQAFTNPRSVEKAWPLFWRFFHDLNARYPLNKAT